MIDLDQNLDDALNKEHQEGEGVRAVRDGLAFLGGAKAVPEAPVAPKATDDAGRPHGKTGAARPGTVVLTQERLDQICTDRGGYTRVVIELLGLPWDAVHRTPRKGWRRAILDSVIPKAVFDECVKQRNAIVPRAKFGKHTARAKRNKAQKRLAKLS